MFYDEKINIYLPGIISLLNNKLQHTYINIFKYIFEDIFPNNINTKYFTITCDFETSIINAIRETFRNSRLVGCYLHFLQALVRKAKSLGYAKANYKSEISDIINKDLGLIPFKYKNNIQEVKDIIKDLKSKNIKNL